MATCRVIIGGLAAAGVGKAVVAAHMSQGISIQPGGWLTTRTRACKRREKRVERLKSSSLKTPVGNARKAFRLEAPCSDTLGTTVNGPIVFAGRSSRVKTTCSSTWSLSAEEGVVFARPSSYLGTTCPNT
ncbi:hypothetical protein BU16DRAFT_545204 [Lophium mytilinum]|uniref:Uncharacterized protein n=1 Tax=Lophium mytilinum TaxID=390894 RepID=A0A6A6Q8Q8_9PEZI|nr:hypothetical protein BU16DRAFT_545204 [Lophium mytilinum]